MSDKQNIPYAGIEMNRVIVKNLARNKIDSLLFYREECKKALEIEKEKLVKRYRREWFGRIFGRKWDDERLIRECSSGMDEWWKTSSYRKACTDSKYAGENTISFCHNLIGLANIETHNNLMWISDEAYRKIREN